MRGRSREAIPLPAIAALLAAMALALRDPVQRRLTLLVAAPLALLWALGFSYDLRNLSLALPFAAAAAGIGVVELAELGKRAVGDWGFAAGAVKNVSRKGAKAQRGGRKDRTWTAVLSSFFLCAFAPLRETLFPAGDFSPACRKDFSPCKPAGSPCSPSRRWRPGARRSAMRTSPPGSESCNGQSPCPTSTRWSTTSTSGKESMRALSRIIWRRHGCRGWSGGSSSAPGERRGVSGNLPAAGSRLRPAARGANRAGDVAISRNKRRGGRAD